MDGVHYKEGIRRSKKSHAEGILQFKTQNSHQCLQAGYKPAHVGFVLDNFGVVLAKFGVILDKFGNVWTHFGNTKKPKNRI